MFAEKTEPENSDQTTAASTGQTENTENDLPKSSFVERNSCSNRTDSSNDMAAVSNRSPSPSTSLHNTTNPCSIQEQNGEAANSTNSGKFNIERWQPFGTGNENKLNQSTASKLGMVHHKVHHHRQQSSSSSSQLQMFSLSTITAIGTIGPEPGAPSPNGITSNGKGIAQNGLLNNLLLFPSMTAEASASKPNMIGEHWPKDKHLPPPASELNNISKAQGRSRQAPLLNGSHAHDGGGGGSLQIAATVQVNGTASLKNDFTASGSKEDSSTDSLHTNSHRNTNAEDNKGTSTFHPSGISAFNPPRALPPPPPGPDSIIMNQTRSNHLANKNKLMLAQQPSEPGPVKTWPPPQPPQSRSSMMMMSSQASMIDHVDHKLPPSTEPNSTSPMLLLLADKGIEKGAFDNHVAHHSAGVNKAASVPANELSAVAVNDNHFVLTLSPSDNVADEANLNANTQQPTSSRSRPDTANSGSIQLGPSELSSVGVEHSSSSLNKLANVHSHDWLMVINGSAGQGAGNANTTTTVTSVLGTEQIELAPPLREVNNLTNHPYGAAIHADYGTIKHSNGHTAPVRVATGQHAPEGFGTSNTSGDSRSDENGVYFVHPSSLLVVTRSQSSATRMVPPRSSLGPAAAAGDHMQSQVNKSHHLTSSPPPPPLLSPTALNKQPDNVPEANQTWKSIHNLARNNGRQDYGGDVATAVSGGGVQSGPSEQPATRASQSHWNIVPPLFAAGVNQGSGGGQHGTDLPPIDVNHCPHQRDDNGHNMSWPRTDAGVLALQLCPLHHYSGTALKLCSLTGRWGRTDMTDCQLKPLKQFGLLVSCSQTYTGLIELFVCGWMD